MDFKEWFLSLSDDERDRYAGQAGTTAGYIRVHLIGRRKIPRADLLRRLALASNGKFTVAKLLAFFYRTEHRVDGVVNTPAQQMSDIAPREQMS